MNIQQMTVHKAAECKSELKKSKDLNCLHSPPAHTA